MPTSINQKQPHLVTWIPKHAIRLVLVASLLGCTHDGPESLGAGDPSGKSLPTSATPIETTEVALTDLTSAESADGATVLVAHWSSGVEPCHRFDRSKLEARPDDTVSVHVYETIDGTKECVDRIAAKSAEIDLATLEPGTYRFVAALVHENGTPRPTIVLTLP